MSLEASNRPLFKPDTEAVLVRGLNAMTQANEVLTQTNAQLRMDVAKLDAEIAHLKERLLVNSVEKE